MDVVCSSHESTALLFMCYLFYFYILSKTKIKSQFKFESNMDRGCGPASFPSKNRHVIHHMTC